MWAIKKFQGSSELTLRAKVTLPNVVSAANRKEVRRLVRSNHVPQGRPSVYSTNARLTRGKSLAEYGDASWSLHPTLAQAVASAPELPLRFAKSTVLFVPEVGSPSHWSATPLLFASQVGPVSMQFEIPMYNVSNLQVRYLKIAEFSKSYNPFR